MKEFRVYLINIADDDISENISDNITDENYLDNATFIAISEKQGNVWTLKGFETDFNYGIINEVNSFIRILETN